MAHIHRTAVRHAMPWLPELHSTQDDFDFFQNKVIPSTETEIALDNGEPVAFLSLREVWIDHLYILPAFWRRGLGTLLVQRAQQRRDVLNLWAFQRNERARAFYASLGFSEEQFTDGSNNEEREPDVQLVWRRTAR